MTNTTATPGTIGADDYAAATEALGDALAAAIAAEAVLWEATAADKGGMGRAAKRRRSQYVEARRSRMATEAAYHDRLTVQAARVNRGRVMARLVTEAVERDEVARTEAAAREASGSPVVEAAFTSTAITLALVRTEQAARAEHEAAHDADPDGTLTEVLWAYWWGTRAALNAVQAAQGI